MTANPIVFVVDDDELVRDSVCALVSTIGVECRTYSSSEEFLQAYQPSQPGCLVTDVRMLGMSGLELQEYLRDQNIELPVIVISAFANTRATVRAMKAGAITFLDKPCNEHELFDVIRQALKLDQQTRDAKSKKQEIQKKLASLNSDERQVALCLVEGMPNKAIAHRLKVSLRTVESRRHKILKKTCVNSVVELVRLFLDGQGFADSE